MLDMIDLHKVLMEPMIGDMFFMGLDSNGLENPTYPNIAVKLYGTVNVHFVECDTNVSLLPLFLHCGSSSKIWYQPNINNRKLHVNNF